MSKDTIDGQSSSEAKDITKDQDGGVLKEIITPGTGEEGPSCGDTVIVHYVGTLENGSAFDSSRDRGEKFEFTLGKGEVIKAWDIGVATMKKGEVCKLICRSEYAYGERGSPPKIPPNATLIFEVELFEWKGEDLTAGKNGGIIRKILEAGEELLTPNFEAEVTITITGMCNGVVFDPKRSITFRLGEGSEYNIPEGVEKALEKFKAKERSRITLLPKYGFGSAGNELLGVSPNSTLEYEIYLESFERAKEHWEMGQEEKLEKAKECKERGTKFFSEEKFKLALKQYKRITDFLQHDNGLDEEQKKEYTTILKAGYLNMSLCHFKLKNYIAARDNANKAIELDATNVKGHFRLAKALLALQEADEARKVLDKCLKLDPTNKAVAQEIRACNAKIKEQRKKDEALYKGMFDTFAKRDCWKNAKNREKSDVMSGDLGQWQTEMSNREKMEDEEREAGYDFSGINDIKMI